MDRQREIGRVLRPMSARYCYDYPRPAVTVDVVAFAFAEKSLRVLLIRRGRAPFAGSWAIPGGFLEIDEPIEVGARRELSEETGLTIPGPLAAIGAFGAPGRDPRGRTISFAHAAVVPPPLPRVGGGDDAKDAAWLDPGTVGTLAFDHNDMLTQAQKWLQGAVDEGPAGLTLLPPRFDDDDVRGLFRALGRPARGARFWRMRLERAGRIAAVRKSGKYQALNG